MGMNRHQIRLFLNLKAHWFTALECRELSTLGKMTPALKAAIADRGQRRARFEKAAAWKIHQGAWHRIDVPRKWYHYLSKLYTKNHWRVQEGPTGNQQSMPKGSMNPWACYRFFEKLRPGKKGVSPWETKPSKGKTYLERGLVFVQQLERGTRKASDIQIRTWIGQKRAAVRKSRDPRRKTQLRIEIRRLEALL